jgi:hypothetical protein
MKLHILTNALIEGDAVTNHCLLMRRLAADLGIEAYLYAEYADEAVKLERFPIKELRERACDGDILLHQFFNESTLIPQVEQFPGQRVLMYHNITPPDYFAVGSEGHRSCSFGLRLVRTLVPLYDHAVGMSEFSRLDLERMGYPRTSVLPLFIDVERLIGVTPRYRVMEKGREMSPTFLSIGRIAPNKRHDDLLRFVAACRRLGRRAGLILVGDDQQHPTYTARLHNLAKQLSLSVGSDVVFTGKVPEDYLVACFRTADAYLSMSDHEGFCAPLIESMGFGLPTIARNSSACEETLGDAGLLLRSRDFEAMAEQVLAALDDSEAREKILATQARRIQDFSFECQRERLSKFLAKFERVAPPRAAFDPSVSVVINTYNRGWLLKRCIEALRMQEYRNFEVVVVNGPSTDDTQVILENLHADVRTVQTDSRVLSVSRNLGIAATRGDLVAFIDDDAIAHPAWLWELVSAFQAPDVGCVGGLVYRMNGGEIEFRNGILDRQGMVRWDEPKPGVHWAWENGYINTVSGNNCIFRRSALEKIGGFDEQIEYYHDEADVVMRMQTAGFRTIHRPGAIVYHEAARSHNRAGKHTLNWYAIVKNTLYCALKNYTGGETRIKAALRVLLELLRQKVRPMLLWWSAREISASEFLRMMSASLRGMGAGLRKGLRPKPLLARFEEQDDQVRFQLFRIQDERSLSVCLLSQGIPPQLVGGIATYTLTLAPVLRDLGCLVHVVSCGMKPESEYRDGIWWHCVPPVPIASTVGLSAALKNASRVVNYSNGVRCKVLDIAARWGLDVLESPSWDAEGLLVALEARMPVAVRVHSPMFKVMETQSWNPTEDLRLCCNLEGLLLRRATAVSGSTKPLLRLVEQHFELPDRQMVLLPLGLSIKGQLSTRHNTADKKVLFVGRLERRKGIHTLLEALPAVLRTLDSVRFDIVGKDVAAENGAVSWAERWKHDHPEYSGRVRFHGEVSEEQLSDSYADCDLFVAPSLFESFGLVYLEAMARGKPVVGTRVGGVPDVVVDGNTGLLVPPEDAPALAESILKILQDDALAETLGRTAFQRYTDHFSAQAMGSNTLAFYKQTLEHWQARREIVWQGDVFSCLRHDNSKVVWLPEARQACLVGEAGEPRTIWFGPYSQLNDGQYRAEFKIWFADIPPQATSLGRLDVFSIRSGLLGEKEISPEDFPVARGSVLDIYFTVPESSTDDIEFRVHTSGVAHLFVREIVVSRYAHQGPKQRR